MVSVECSCKVCAENAERLGVALPLRASVPARLLEQCKGKAHGLVFTAHDPSIVGRVARERAGIVALGGVR